MYDEFVEDYEPTKADSYRKKVVLDGEEVISIDRYYPVFSYTYSLQGWDLNTGRQVNSLEVIL